MSKVCSRGHQGKPVEGVCVRCREIAAMECDPGPAEQVPPTIDDHGATYHPDASEQG